MRRHAEWIRHAVMIGAALFTLSFTLSQTALPILTAAAGTHLSGQGCNYGRPKVS